MSPSRPQLSGLKALCLVLSTALAFSATACSHKDPVAPEAPGEPEVFFNWLPALLVDQGPASQPAHEIMQWMDDPANFPVASKRPELAQILARLGNATQTYRQTGASRPTDQPILEAIDVYIEQMRKYLNNEVQYLPLTTQQLERDRG